MERVRPGRKGKWLLVGFTVTCIASTLPAFAAEPLQVNQHSTTPRVFKDRAAFEAAQKDLPSSRSVSTDAQIAARELEISRRLHRTTEEEAMEAVAREFDLLIFNPTPGSMEIQSGTEHLTTIQAPSVVWDNITKRSGIWGQAHWNDADAIRQDANLTRGAVGKNDTVGLVFSNMPSSAIKSRYIITSDQNGGNLRTNGNPAYQPSETDGRRALMFKGQDNYLGPSNGVYDWWNMEIWTWYTPGPHGEVFMVVGHDWDTVEVTGASFSLDPGSECCEQDGAKWSVGLGLSISFSKVNYQWATAGLTTEY